MGSRGRNEAVVQDHPRPWVVKVLRSSTQGARAGEPAGAGLLVSPRAIVTCAHVLQEALGVNPATLPEWSPVDVEVRLEPGKRARMQANVLLVQTEPTLNLAVLSLAADANPEPLVWGEPNVGRATHVFGYPGGLRPGSWSRYNEVAGPVDDGWWMLEAGGQTSQKLAAGYSGAPVWDVAAEAVVGMLVQANASDPPSGNAYFLPAATIHEICRLLLSTQRSRRSPRPSGEAQRHS
jgi:cellulose synthase operon protein C